MKLPNAHLVTIEREKITEYLLNPAHPDNGGKAAFFKACGFSQENWQTLAESLRDLAGSVDVIKSLETMHGCKYITEGRIDTPGGKKPSVRVVWIVDQGLTAPRLVTAYPRKE